MADYIKKDDTLNEGRVKLNKAIKDSKDAKTTSEQAGVKAAQALANSESTQEQLNQVVIEGDSSVEAAQARIDEKGQTHSTLKERIDDGFNKVNSQLADEVNKNNLIGWELQNKVRKLEPLVTIFDDDGYPHVLDKLLPLSELYDIPFVVGAISKRVQDGVSHSMTPEQLRMLQDEHNWEITSHTHSHRRLADLAYEEQEYELKHSKEILESYGLKINNICYPFGSRNKDTAELTRKYYRSGRRTEHAGRINLAPLETYDVVVTPLGSYFDTSSNLPYEPDSLEYYKHQVDKAIENNGWLIFMTHCYSPDHDETQQEYLEEVIKYIQSKNVEIVTYDEALNRRANIVDIGRYSLDVNDETDGYFVVGADGSYRGTDLQNISKIETYRDRADKSPKGYTPRSVTYEFVNYSLANEFDMPEKKHGNLITTLIHPNDRGEGNVRQTYYVANSNHIYIRYSVNETTWSDWELLNNSDVLLGTNAKEIDADGTDYINNRLTVFRITNTNTPANRAGTLKTDRLSGSAYYIHQTFEPSERWDVYRRYWNNNNKTWSDWKKLVYEDV